MCPVTTMGHFLQLRTAYNAASRRNASRSFAAASNPLMMLFAALCAYLLREKNRAHSECPVIISEPFRLNDSALTLSKREVQY